MQLEKTDSMAFEPDSPPKPNKLVIPEREHPILEPQSPIRLPNIESSMDYNHIAEVSDEESITEEVKQEK